MNDIVSIIIPVHNGANYLNKTIKRLMSQNYSDFEIILVENNSSDNSWEICQNIQNKESRVRAFSVRTKGTALARKYGVLQAKGIYILFHDQDDMILDPMAIECMVHAIKQDGTDICQFGYYKALGKFIRNKIPKESKEHIQVFTRKQIMDYQIKGILGFGWSPDIVLTTQVWNKIYKADILKNAVQKIKEPLYFCEDEYLNIFAFFDSNVNSVSVRREYYYYWNVGIGFSSSQDAKLTFLQDYQYIKNASVPLLKMYSNKNILMQAFWDSLTVYKWTIYNMIYNRIPRNKVVEVIEKIENYQYIKEAKNELKSINKSEYYPDLNYLTSDYSPESYYEYCQMTLPMRKKKAVIKQSIKETILRVKYFFWR